MPPSREETLQNQNRARSVQRRLKFMEHSLVLSSRMQIHMCVTCACSYLQLLGSSQEKGGHIEKKECIWQYTHIL